MSTTATSPIRVMLVDSHVLFRQALGCLLATRGEMDITSETDTLAQALATGAADRPHVILLSLAPAGDLNLESIPMLVGATAPESRLLVLTTLADDHLCRQAIHLGARGVVRSSDTADVLVRAIRKVHDGEVWLERRLVADLVMRTSHLHDGPSTRTEMLTRRERDVVRLVAEGLKNKQIADRLSIADITVRHHLTSVFAKLGVTDRLSLVVYAFTHGLALPDGGRQHRRA